MSETVLFDTHRVIKEFIASGFTERQAEVMIEQHKSIIENNLATKKDIAEIKKEIAALNVQIAEIKKDMKLMEKKIINKMYVSLFACFGLFTTIMTVIIKFSLNSFLNSL